MHLIPLPLLISLISLPFLSSSSPAPVAEPQHFPLTRRRPASNRTLEYFASVADNARARYGFPTVAQTQQKRASTSALSITNQNADSSYFGTVSIGSPPQQLSVILDTGSSDLWVAGSSCQSCPSGTPTFNPSQSSSLQTPNTANSQVQISYGSGQVAGTLASDTVTMAGFSVGAQDFAVVTQITSGLLSGSVSGIMGLAFQTIASTQAVPFWQALTNANQLTSPEFSFWLTRFINDNSATADEPGGVLTFGGTNSSLYTGNIEFQDMPSGVTPSFWLLEVSSLTVGGKSVQISTGTAALAAIDTGTTLIGGPSTDVSNFWAQVPGSQQLTGNMVGYYSFPCSTSLSVSIAFGGQSWPINSADMNLGTVSDGQCLGGIFDLTAGSNAGGAGSGAPSWVVGDTFLKNVYSVFRSNPPSVGFAQLSNAAGGSSGSPSGSTTGTTSSSSGAGSSQPSGGSSGAGHVVRLPGSTFGVLVAGAIVVLASGLVL